uniref:IgGFc_binding domain-containing protein n=1 Tax=Rhabditophanes sp. KR3021 TaxID=114890 RepID=A0AC35TJY6_9BILA
MNDESAADFRIFAHCNEKVKLIGRISDPINSFGDLFLIPSVTFAASKYVIELPTSSDERLGSISFLPVSQTGTIDITAIGYAGRSQYETLRLSYDTTVGSPQYYTSSWFRVFANSSVSITSSSPIMILVTAPFVTISSIPSEYCGESCHQDYVAFMPIGAPFRKCGSKTKNAEERMSTHHFASRMYISPPNELDSCNDNPQITIYDDIDDAAGRAISVSKIGETAISLINKNQTGFLTYGGQMSSYRLGSIVQPDGITAFGHFAHYLPSRAEWISGPTQFYTFAKNCYLEIYISAPVIDLKRVKIDGTPLQNIKHTETPIFMFVVNIMQYVVPIKGYGMHLLENEVGTSVSYVVCKNVNGAFNSAGYLTGFNKIASN